MMTITFYENGRKILFPARYVPTVAMKACIAQNVDIEDMRGIMGRLIRDEDAREMFESITGLEIVLNA